MANNWTEHEAHCIHHLNGTPLTPNDDYYIQSESKPTQTNHMLHNKIIEYQKLAQYHIKLAVIMRDHHQFRACLILCDWTLSSMLKALFIQKYSTYPPKELTMNEILPLVHMDKAPGLEMALFIGTMQYLSSLEDCSHDQLLELRNIETLVQRTEEILNELTTRMMNDLPKLPKGIVVRTGMVN